jgi:hypothetical protein
MSIIKRWVHAALIIIFSYSSALSQDKINQTSISFKGNKEFISSLALLLSQDFDTADVKKALEPFNAGSVGYRAATKEELFENLPLASNDLIISSRNLGLFESPKTLVELQEAIYISAVGVIYPEFAKQFNLGKAVPAAALLGVAIGLHVDSEPRASASISASSSAIAENGGTSTITVALSGTVTAATDLTLGFSSTATQGSDFSASSTVSIPAGQTSGTFTVTSIDDSVYEGDETGTITISSVSNPNVSISSSNAVTLTITEDETVPTVSLAASGNSIAEESGGSITFTASIDQVASVDLTVTITTTVNSRAYTANVPTSIDITIPAGSLTGTATFTPTDNDTFDGTSNVSFAISSVVGGGAVGNTVVIPSSGTSETVAVTETEAAPLVQLSASGSSVAENGSAITLTATLSGSTYADVTVTLTGSGIATSGSDYSIANITIAAGTTTGTASFTPIEDNLYEGSDETAIVSITNVSGGNALESGDQAVTLTITDNETAPTVTLASNVSSVAEDGGAATVTATLSNATYADVTVALVGAGTATPDTDYTYTTSITIAAGSTTGTASGVSVADDIYEGNETAEISISSVSGGNASESGAQVVSITITDAENAPTVTLASSASSVTEGDSALTLTASLSVATTSDVSVILDTSGTATEGSDYSAISDITISAGSTTGTASFTVTDDSVYEGSEAATVSIGSVSGGSASLASSGTSASITLADNETAPTVNLSSSYSSVLEDGSAITVTATLSNVAGEAVTVPLVTSGTATEGTDYAAISDITISAGATTGTATITPTDDSVSEGAETLIVSLGTLSGADATAGSTSSLTLSLVDDDVPNITLTSSASSIAENSGSSLTLTATASMTAREDIVVTLGTAGTATSGTDYTALPATLTITAGATTATASFIPSDDDFYDATSNETAIVSITNVSGGNALESGDQAVTLTITDNESEPTVTLSVNSSSIAENSGSSISVTATLSNKSYQTITVGLSATGGDATVVSGTDFSVPSSITIPANETSASISFTPSDDSLTPVYEEDETVTLAISGVTSGNASLGSTLSQTVTIAENETVPSVTLTGTTSIDEKTETADVTAALSIEADAAITLALSKSGTATNSTDYSISDITVLAGSTSASSTLTPVSDTDYEGGSETVILSASASGISGISNSNEITITITNKALNSGTQLTYNSSTATARALEQEFRNFSADQYAGAFSHSEQNSLEIINAHKAYAYGLTGANKIVAVVDTGFDTDHKELNDIGKITATYGTLSTSTSTSYHGTSVAGIIAADDDGDSGLLGVAPNAKLHLSSYNNKGSETYYASHWSNLTDHASTAVAQNNSWGVDYQVDTMQNLMSSSSISAASAAATIWTAQGFTSDVASVNEYVSSLNSFQNHGVVVYALSNDSSFTDADFQAALPVLFTDLNEAWITAVNIDIDGVAGAEVYTKKSAPCGQSAPFCLGADGHGLNTLAHNDQYKFHVYSSGGSYYVNTGTSWVAPMISGAVAIMAEAFPNQTPEQWTDRLLASAKNNIGFAYVGSVTFGNGVVHEYSSEAGHGILDIYAALQPITSSSYISRVNAVSAKGGSESFAFKETSILSARSFGDAISEALSGEFTYMYDALDGGFAFDLDQAVQPSLMVSKPSISASSEIGRTILTKRLYENLTRKKVRDPATDGYFEFSMTQSNQSLNDFASEGSWSGLNDTQYMFPFMSDVQGGTGLSFGNSIGEDYFSLSYTQQHEDLEDGDLKQAFTFSYGTEFGESTEFEIIAGFVDEQEYFLGTKGSGAFDFSGADNNTSFMGFKSTSLLGDRLILNAGASLSYTDVNKPSSGIITEISDVTASAFELGVTKFGVLGGDALSFSLGQPHRVEDGNAHLQIAGLENSDGTVPYTYKSATLAPSGRQIDLSMAYNFDLSKKSAIRFKTMHTLEKGHVAGADPENSLFLGYASERIFGDDQFAMGAALTDANDTTVNMNYTIQW